LHYQKILHKPIILNMTIDKNLQEYLIEVTVKDVNLQGIVDSLKQTGFKLDKKAFFAAYFLKKAMYLLKVIVNSGI